MTLQWISGPAFVGSSGMHFGLGVLTKDQIKSAQIGINVMLIQEGMRTISVDGKLGPRTCGANAWLINRLGTQFIPPGECAGFGTVDPSPSGGVPGVENFYRNARDAALAERNAAGEAAGKACAPGANPVAASQAADEAVGAAERARQAVKVTPPTSEADKIMMADAAEHVRIAEIFEINAIECAAQAAGPPGPPPPEPPPTVAKVKKKKAGLGLLLLGGASVVAIGFALRGGGMG